MRTYRASVLPALARRLGIGVQGSPHELADQLASTSHTDRLDATASEFDIGPVRLTGASLEKRGASLVTRAALSEADLRAALPGFLKIGRIRSGSGGLVLHGSVSAFGRRLSADFTLAARGGRLLLSPNIPLGGIVTLTLFADPRVKVEDVAARALPGRYLLSARASVP